MKGITVVGCSVIVALVACSLFSTEAKTDKLLVPPQAEKSGSLEKSQGNSPELTQSVTESKSAIIAENKNAGLSDGPSSVGQLKLILKKRDEISDYEGWGWESKKITYTSWNT